MGALRERPNLGEVDAGLIQEFTVGAKGPLEAGDNPDEAVKLVAGELFHRIREAHLPRHFRVCCMWTFASRSG